MIYFFPLLFLLISGCEKDPEKKPILKRIINKIQKNKLTEKKVKEKAERLDFYFGELQKKKGFNGVVLVAHGTQIVFEKAFGYSNYKKKIPLSTDAVFQLASVSKQFTAAAIMLLKQRGMLTYEDSIQTFFPDFPYKGITVKQLLTHHSGLTNYTYFCDKVWDRKTPIDNQTVIRLMSEQNPAPYYRPGVKYDYSNTGYILLAAIVEKLANMKFEDFMKKNIFIPCQMTETYIYNHGTPVITSNCVDGYNYGRRKVERTYLDGTVGDKGVYSTVRDMYRWNRILFTDSLMSQDIIKEAYEPGYERKKNKNKDNYGFGWRIKEHKKGKVVWHSGWWEGFKPIFLRNLKDETVIIVLSNSLAGHLKSEEILDVYYD